MLWKASEILLVRTQNPGMVESTDNSRPLKFVLMMMTSDVPKKRLIFFVPLHLYHKILKVSF